MPNIYFYKMTADNGGAPCVDGGLLSLAICKPMIRSTADVGDLLFGFAANSLHRDNCLIYVARVTRKESGGGYYYKREYARRGDRIYGRRNDRFYRRPGAQYHQGPGNLAHDLGNFPGYNRANVLLSTDFRYFRTSGSARYKGDYTLIAKAVKELGRGHRVHLDESLYREFQSFADDVFESTRLKVNGAPATRPRPGISHRGSGCGVVKSVGSCE